MSCCWTTAATRPAASRFRRAAIAGSSTASGVVGVGTRSFCRGRGRRRCSGRPPDGCGRHPAVEPGQQAGEGEEEHGDADAGDGDRAGPLGADVEEGVGVPAGDGADDEGPDQPGDRPGEGAQRVAPRARGRGPATSQPMTASSGTTMCSSLSAAQLAPSRSSSGRSSTKCTRPGDGDADERGRRAPAATSGRRAAGRGQLHGGDGDEQVALDREVGDERPSRVSSGGTSVSASTESPATTSTVCSTSAAMATTAVTSARRGRGTGSPARA